MDMDLGHSPRHDGWTAARRRAFVDALARGWCVEEACAALGPSVSSLYRVRARHPGFAAAWDAARAAARQARRGEVQAGPELAHIAHKAQHVLLVPELRAAAPRQTAAPLPVPELRRPPTPQPVPELRAAAPALTLLEYLSRPGAVIGRSSPRRLGGGPAR